jgi:hypothetical protein
MALPATLLLAVSIRSFTASRRAAGVTVRWRTSSENHLLGFNVLRSAAGRTVKVKRALVQARAEPASYRLADRAAGPGVVYRYFLQAVDRSGAARLVGFALVRAA